MKFFLAFLLFSLMAAGQATEPAGATLQGTVRSSLGGPVFGAVASINGVSANTDERGRFTLQNVPPGKDLRLVVDVPGYAQGAYGARQPGETGTLLTLVPGQELQDLTVLVIPNGSITGRVMDGEGNPKPNVFVALLRPAFVGGNREMRLARNASADENGEFQIVDVAPGSYRLRVTDPTSRVATYYPNSPDLLGAAEIQVYAGLEAAGMDIRIRVTDSFTIRGKAVDRATGEPMAELQVAVMPLNDPPSILWQTRKFVVTDQDGFFEVSELKPGPYALQVITHEHTARVDVLVTKGDAEDVVVRVRPSGVIRGTMRLEEGDVRSLIPAGSPKLVGFEPSSKEKLIAVNEHMRAVTDSRLGKPVKQRPSVEMANENPGLGTSGMGVLQDDGTFEVSTIPAGTFRIAVEFLPPGHYVKSALFNGVDALHIPVNLRESDGDLQLVISNEAGNVAGTLRDKQGIPRPSTVVRMWPKIAKLGWLGYGIFSAVTDGNGAFELRSVPPDEYFLAGWEGEDARAEASPLFLDLFRSSAAEVRVGDQDQKKVDAKLITAPQIAEQVRRAP